MRNWISFPHREGTHSRQAHADLPEQAIYERELGRSGFFGPATHMHHKHAPTDWVNWEGPLRPRAFDLNDLQEEVSSLSPWVMPDILSNPHCRYRIWRLHEPMPFLVRNADGDELLFIHEGSGEFYCDYGHLILRDGDYVVIPRGTMWRIEPTAPLFILMIEATEDSYQLPDKGLVGNHAIFDPAALDVPAINERFLAQQDENPWSLQIKRHDQVSVVTWPFNPLDAQGGTGTCAWCASTGGISAR